MRRPLVTARELGPSSFVGLQILMAGLILSALVHPWLYILGALHFGLGILSGAQEFGALSTVVATFGLSNLVLGYVFGIALGVVAMKNRNRPSLALWALTMPFYWLLISFAAYRAAFQIISAPYRWEKTRHRPRAVFASASSPALAASAPVRPPPTA